MPDKNNRAFTLIEVVITVVLLSLLATMILPFYKTGAFENMTVINRLQNSSNVNAAIAKIVADYENNACCNLKDSAALTALQTRINNFSTNYGTYCSNCTPTVTYPYAIGNLTNTLLVTITNNATNESISHIFTIQQ